MRAFITLASCLALTACAGPDWVGGPLVTPGKYRPADCKALEGQLKAQTAAVRKYDQLDERARREAGGAVISGLAYGLDSRKARGELAEMQAEMRAKGCPAAGS